jgi:hypothetical protein
VKTKRFSSLDNAFPPIDRVLTWLGVRQDAVVEIHQADEAMTTR